MKITPVTLFLVFFSVSMILLVLSRIKKDAIGLRSALVWILIMAGIGVFSLFPGLLDWAIRFSRMKERMIFVLLTAVFILLAFIFNLSTRHDRMQRDLSKIIQELALINYRLEKKEKKKTDGSEA